MLKLKRWILFCVILSCNYCFADTGVLKIISPTLKKLVVEIINFYSLMFFTATTYAPMGKLSLDKPFALQLCYARDLKGEDIAKSN